MSNPKSPMPISHPDYDPELKSLAMYPWGRPLTDAQKQWCPAIPKSRFYDGFDGFTYQGPPREREL